MPAFPTAAAVILVAAGCTASLPNLAVAAPDGPSCASATYAKTTSSERILLQFTGKLSRLERPAAYDNSDALADVQVPSAEWHRLLEVPPTSVNDATQFGNDRSGLGQSLELNMGSDGTDLKQWPLSDLVPVGHDVGDSFNQGHVESDTAPLPDPNFAGLELHPRLHLPAELMPLPNPMLVEELGATAAGWTEGDWLPPSVSPAEEDPLLSLSILSQPGQSTKNSSCAFAWHGKPICGRMTIQNCGNASTTAGACPASCKYILPDPLFSCGAACVAQEGCAKLGGATLSFSDPVTGKCAKGPISGCIHYDGPNVCRQCGKLLKLTTDGTACVFLPRLQQFARGLFIVVVVLLVILLPLNFYRWCCQRVGNQTVLTYGWRHRLRVIASVSKFQSPLRMRDRLPMGTNMHTELVAGAGLCLFYNSLLFLLVVSLLVAIVFTLIWSLTIFPNIGYAGECRLGSNKDFNHAVDNFIEYQKVSAICCGCLWMVVFAFSLYWARCQHLAYRSLDARTSLMSDFAFRVSGLPRDAYENEIATFFESLLPAVTIGVSVAYDYRGHKELIAQLLAQHVQKEERRLANLGFAELRVLERLPGQQDPEQDSLADKERGVAVAVLSRLQGSGVAFVVCTSESDRERLYDRWTAQRPWFRGQNELCLSLVQEEPCCFLWENFAYDRRAHLLKGFVELVVLSIEIICLGLVVYWPAAYFIFHRLRATGNDSPDPVVMLLGYGIAILNCILYVLVGISSRRVGFFYRSDVDICNLVGCTVIVGAQTFFNLTVAYYAVKSVDASMSATLFSAQGDDDRIVRDASGQVFIAAKLFNLMVPGILVVPDVVGRLFKYVLSSTAMYDYWVYIPFFKQDLRTDADVTTHEAETQLLPAPMQTEFDYSNSICITSTAFLMLFFHSEYTALTCWILVGWVLLSYISLKCCHLRFNMMVDYTSHHLDDCFTYLWGIPVSILAAASAHWAAILNHWPWWVKIVAFSTSFVVYLILVRWVLKSVDPYDNGGKGDYVQARRVLRYDYFNTNPVQVLKSRFLREGKPLTYFVRGKEYLQQIEKVFAGRS